jgi:hypothetical protein
MDSAATLIWELHGTFAPGKSKSGGSRGFSINTDNIRFIGFRGKMALLEDFGLSCYNPATASLC